MLSWLSRDSRVTRPMYLDKLSLGACAADDSTIRDMCGEQAVSALKLRSMRAAWLVRVLTLVINDVVTVGR